LSTRIIIGDALDSLRGLPSGSVRCCVTSPPYWGLRDYGVPGQLGLERTPQEYVAGMVAVFREVWRVLTDDGTLWLNLGDSYAAGGHGGGGSFMDMRGTNGSGAWAHRSDKKWWKSPPPGLKQKDLVGIPWRVAFALQDDGWWLRSEIIWSKPNPMPESVTDRPTKAHEQLFLLAKSQRYYYDADAIATPLAESSVARLAQPTLDEQEGSARLPGKTNGNMKAVFGGRGKASGYGTRWHGGREDEGNYLTNGVNSRSVWIIPTCGYKEAHFATFPPELPRRCILAGSAVGDTVLDPFAGAGTTLLVADRLGRHGIGIELNPTYAAMAEERVVEDAPLFNRADHGDGK
jgi:DNA modification methylase